MVPASLGLERADRGALLTKTAGGLLLEHGVLGLAVAATSALHQAARLGPACLASDEELSYWRGPPVSAKIAAAR
jgi:hypothetical protein